MFNQIAAFMKQGAVFAIIMIPPLCNNRTFIYVKSSSTKKLLLCQQEKLLIVIHTTPTLRIRTK